LLFPFFATRQIYQRCVIDSNGNIATSAKFAIGINDTSGTGGKFTAGVIDTCGKFVTGVVDTGGKFVAGFVDNKGAP
jgi:hypothetical protein